MDEKSEITSSGKGRLLYKTYRKQVETKEAAKNFIRVDWVGPAFQHCLMSPHRFINVQTFILETAVPRFELESNPTQSSDDRGLLRDKSTGYSHLVQVEYKVGYILSASDIKGAMESRFFGPITDKNVMQNRAMLGYAVVD